MNRNIMKQAGLHEELARIDRGHCPTCDASIDPGAFRDALSRKEFTISGICQGCQDSVFGWS